MNKKEIEEHRRRLIELTKELKKENKELRQKIDKAIEYTKHIDDWDIKDFVREELLLILEV